MSAKTLFLAWQDQDKRQWFPVGRLDADVRGPEYRFRYTKGAQRAQVEACFPLLPDFPKVDRDYRSKGYLHCSRTGSSQRGDRTAVRTCIALDCPKMLIPLPFSRSMAGGALRTSTRFFPSS